ncbi:alanine racemase, partial [Schumannella luteola]
MGVSRARVSDERDAAVARAGGMADVAVGRTGDGDTAARAVYGISGGRPVLTLLGELVAVKHVPAGSGVSYGYTHRTERPTVLGLVGLGYAD